MPATIIRFTTLEITVATATPITPQLNTNKNTELSIILKTFPTTVPIKECFVYPNTLK